jgi:Flp pilus assembly pilin Flp
MKRVMDVGRRFLREEDGIAVTEYGMLFAVVAAGLLFVIKTFRDDLKLWFSNTTKAFFTDAAK